MQGLLIRVRPHGPWRYGPGDGGLDRVDTLYRSDRLYSAVTLAMRQLGQLEEWLDATALAAAPAVVFSSLFPFQADTLFAAPPTSLWPPPANLLTTPSPTFLTKIRWKAARFVPMNVIDLLLTGQPLLAEQWLPDPESGCLLRRDRPSSSPFRFVLRRGAPVDRLTRSGGDVTSAACVEFEQNAGLWTLARFSDGSAESVWSNRVQAAFRLLADSGFGGGRSRGWGQTEGVDFTAGNWPGLLLPKVSRLQRNGAPDANGESGLYWLLSLYSPSASDKVDWTGGDYTLIVRGGRIESNAASGELKKSVRMISEGCVVAASAEPIGSAVDVAPDGFPHPVYRSGLALALRFPHVQIRSEDLQAIEEPQTAEAVIEPAEAVIEPAEAVIPETVIEEAGAGSLEEEPASVHEAETNPVEDVFENTEAHDVPAAETVEHETPEEEHGDEV